MRQGLPVLHQPGFNREYRYTSIPSSGGHVKASSPAHLNDGVPKSVSAAPRNAPVRTTAPYAEPVGSGERELALTCPARRRILVVAILSLKPGCWQTGSPCRITDVVSWAGWSRMMPNNPLNVYCHRGRREESVRREATGLHPPETWRP